MIDPRREAVLIADRGTRIFVDQTRDVVRFEVRPDRGIVIWYRNGRSYPYGPDRVRVLRRPTSVPLPPGTRVEVDGVVWDGVTDIVAFTGPEGEWRRIFRRRDDGRDDWWTYPARQVQPVTSAEQNPVAGDVLGYWRSVLHELPADDPLQRAYDELDFVHPDSVLGRYLTGTPVTDRGRGAVPIFPFHCNISQREAVELGLSRSVSVIEGPPGTGKTETILNLVANIVAADMGSVAVVSHANPAVANVLEKLDKHGVGHMAASLGRREKREEFFAGQADRNEQVTAFLQAAPPTSPRSERLAELDRRLRDLQEHERRRADLRGELDAHQLELRHFVRHLEQEEMADLENLPLLRRSSGRILDYLAESGLESEGVRPGLLRRIRRYFRYGSLRGLEPDDTAMVLRLQRAYYEKRIVELGGEIEAVEEKLRRDDFDRLAAEHHALSVQALGAALAARYGPRPRVTYTEAGYRRGTTFRGFLRDYPVVLSTCHSLRRSLARGHLLDYLVIDEASQVDLLTAGLALSCCRNVIVVGDLRQLPPIVDERAAGLDPPAPAYDYRRHSILSSLIELYGPDLPRTLLREHYRCDPAIIGFCNKAFYDGELIPFTTGRHPRPMVVHRTVEGNHMRQYRAGGRSNRREADVIRDEVIPDHCADVDDSEIGVVTPYRRQVDAVVDALLDRIETGIETDTVHKYQGRQKDVMILTTVLDDTWRGRTGLKFVDDPQKINVAVSRAGRRLVVVTNYEMQPTSRHISDLIGYIKYQNPGEEIVDSAVVSMFDLLYRRYDDRLRPLAKRLRNEMDFRSEDIVWTELKRILTEEQYAHLFVGHHVLVRNLLADPGRLTPRQKEFVRHRASVDFVVYNRVTNRPRLAVEVDGFKYHEDDPVQTGRDRLKDEIFADHGLRLLRLRTTGSSEEQRIRQALDAAEVEDRAPVR